MARYKLFCNVVECCSTAKPDDVITENKAELTHHGKLIAKVLPLLDEMTLINSYEANHALLWAKEDMREFPMLDTLRSFSDFLLSAVSKHGLAPSSFLMS